MKIPLPQEVNTTSTQYTIKDVIEAIDTIQKFIKVKREIDKIITTFSSYGIPIDFSTLSNPNMLMKYLISIRKYNSSIDVDEIIQKIKEFNDIRLDDISRACNIIRSFAVLGKSVSQTIEYISKISPTSSEDMDIIKSIFNIDRITTKHIDIEEDVVEPTPIEEKETLRKEIKEKRILEK